MFKTRCSVLLFDKPPKSFLGLITNLFFGEWFKDQIDFLPSGSKRGFPMGYVIPLSLNNENKNLPSLDSCGQLTNDRIFTISRRRVLLFGHPADWIVYYL